MITIEELRTYCLSKKETTEDFPFDNDTLVFKVSGKLFALAPLKKWEEGAKIINLKCDPDTAEKLRAQYQSIYAGYHMNKRHWNSINMSSGELDIAFIKKLIDDSYTLVIKKLPKKKRPDNQRI